MTGPDAPGPGVGTAGPVTTDEEVAALLAAVRRVAVVGVSDRFTRPSFRVGAYLLDRTGWDVVLVNPHVVETLGRPCAAGLPAGSDGVDLVVVFRAAAAWPAVIDEAAAEGARGVWLPSGEGTAAEVSAALARGRAAGLTVVTERDVRADHRRWGAPGGEAPIGGDDSRVVRRDDL